MLPQGGNIGRQPQAGAGRTPALRLQPEESPPSLPAFASLAFCPPFHSPASGIRTTPAARRSRKANQGGPGEIISPGGVRGGAPQLLPVPFLSCVSCLFGGLLDFGAGVGQKLRNGGAAVASFELFF